MTERNPLPPCLSHLAQGSRLPDPDDVGQLAIVRDHIEIICSDGGSDIQRVAYAILAALRDRR